MLKSDTEIFAAHCASVGAAMSSEEWLSERDMFCPKVFFYSTLYSLGTQSHCTHGAHSCHKDNLFVLILYTTSFCRQTAPETNRPAKESETDGLGTSCGTSRPLTAFRRPLKPNQTALSVTLNPSCFSLPSFAGMHHAPRNARLQIHVHVTNRMPQLHQRDCMAHPKKPKTSNKIFFLNNSSFGQNRRGKRSETICRVMSPLRKMGIMLCGGKKEAMRSRVRSGFGKAGSASGGGVKLSLSNHRPSTSEPHCRWTHFSNNRLPLTHYLCWP